MLSVLVMYIEVVQEPNIMSGCIKAFLDDAQWTEHIKDPQMKQIKRQTSSILTWYTLWMVTVANGSFVYWDNAPKNPNMFGSNVARMLHGMLPKFSRQL